MERDARTVNAEALVELLRTEGLDFHNSARSWVLDCPLCGKRKWAIRKTDGYSKCYRCDHDFKGWADYTLSVALKRPKAEFSALLYGVVLTTVEREEPQESRWVDHWEELERDDVEVIDLTAWPPEVFRPPDHHALDSKAGAPGLRYLEGRGISLELAKAYDLRYNPVEERVIFPIVVEGVLRGWQGRLIHKGEYVDKQGRERTLPKALTELPANWGGKVLMFHDRLKGSKHGIIAEGPMDALKCHLAGGNAATMGKSVTAEQLDIYVRHFGLRELYLGLDDDAAEDIERLCSELSWYKDIQVYRLRPAPGREDLGEGTLEENLEQFRTAEPIKFGQVFSFLQNDRYW